MSSDGIYDTCVECVHIKDRDGDVPAPKDLCLHSLGSEVSVQRVQVSSSTH